MKFLFTDILYYTIIIYSSWPNNPHPKEILQKETQLVKLNIYWKSLLVLTLFCYQTASRNVESYNNNVKWLFYYYLWSNIKKLTKNCGTWKEKEREKRILVGIITNNNKNCNSKITSKYGYFSIFKFKNLKKSSLYQWGNFLLLDKYTIFNG